ncbi:MAG: nickel-responsive transcriptional regulator NikR [Kiritimatiellia bacterium]
MKRNNLKTKPKELAERISISLPSPLARELDRLVVSRGFHNRSQAIREMINQQLSQHAQISGTQVLAGTITLFYDDAKPRLRTRLAEIQRKHINEVISSQHVPLENNHTMEVLLVQGPGDTLRQIADELVSCKGVTTGGLNLTSSVLPPIHGKTDNQGNSDEITA